MIERERERDGRRDTVEKTGMHIREEELGLADGVADEGGLSLLMTDGFGSV